MASSALPERFEEELQRKVSTKVSVQPEGTHRYRILTPFMFDDGDHYVIVLRRSGGRWLLTDEGHTLMHLSYWMDSSDLRQGTRAEAISSALKEFGVRESEGEIQAEFEPDEVGNRFFDFIQALSRIADTTILSRERVRSTFLEDLHKLIHDTVAADRVMDDWFDASRDPKGKYLVSYRIEAVKTPLLVFALPSESSVRDATITLLTFRDWKLRNYSLGIHEDLEEISSMVEARFTDVVDKQFSSLADNADRIEDYIEQLTEGQ